MMEYPFIRFNTMIQLISAAATVAVAAAVAARVSGGSLITSEKPLVSVSPDL